MFALSQYFLGLLIYVCSCCVKFRFRIHWKSGFVWCYYRSSLWIRIW